MPSWQMRGVALFIRATRKRRYATEAGGHRMLAETEGRHRAARQVRPRARGHLTDGRRRVEVHTVRPLGPDSGRPGGTTVVYLHGGAYVSEIAPAALVAGLADRARDRRHRCGSPLRARPAAPGDGGPRTCSTSCCASSIPAGPVHLAGDSAGGGFALALAQRWDAAAYPPLSGLTLIAPWLDLEMKNPGIDAVEPHDPWLTRPGLRPAAAAWAGEPAARRPAGQPGQRAARRVATHAAARRRPRHHRAGLPTAPRPGEPVPWSTSRCPAPSTSTRCCPPRRAPRGAGRSSSTSGVRRGAEASAHRGVDT